MKNCFFLYGSTQTAVPFTGQFILEFCDQKILELKVKVLIPLNNLSLCRMVCVLTPELMSGLLRTIEKIFEKYYACKKISHGCI